MGFNLEFKGLIVWDQTVTFRETSALASLTLTDFCFNYTIYFDIYAIYFVFLLEIYWTSVSVQINKHLMWTWQLFPYLWYFINKRRKHILLKKWSRYRAGVAQRVGRGIALLFHDRGTRRGWVVSSTHWPHFNLGKTRYPLNTRLWGPQGRSGRVENLVPTGIRSRSVQPVVNRYAESSTWPIHYVYNCYLFHVSTNKSFIRWRWRFFCSTVGTEKLKVNWTSSCGPKYAGLISTSRFQIHVTNS